LAVRRVRGGREASTSTARAIGGDPRPEADGWGSRPDYGRPEVRRYLRDNALSWLQDYRIDGLRLDATEFVRTATGDGGGDDDIPEGWSLLREINGDVDASQPWKAMIAEDMRGYDRIVQPIAAQGAGFDAQWDDDFLWRVRAR
jgi:1,4-alpha-glucan branching enzyme